MVIIEQIPAALQRDIVTQTCAEFFEQVKLFLHVNYTETVENKEITAAVFLQQHSSGRKYIVGRGHATCFHDERFVRSIGEARALELALIDAHQMVNHFAFFEMFLRDFIVVDSISEPSSTWALLGKFVKPGEI